MTVTRKALFLIALGVIVPTAFCADGGKATLPQWHIQFALAQEGEGDQVSIPEELEMVRGVLEKLAKQSKFRSFPPLKEEKVPFEEKKAVEVAFDPDLKVTFQLETKNKKEFLKVAWLKRDPRKPEDFKQVGGTVSNPFLPGKALVILGPKAEQGVALAVLRLEPAAAD
jgi:hypothetical protein